MIVQATPHPARRFITFEAYNVTLAGILCHDVIEDVADPLLLLPKKCRSAFGILDLISGFDQARDDCAIATEIPPLGPLYLSLAESLSFMATSL
jgi:hypothetical protein